MKANISKSTFRDEFRDYGRGNQFSQQGLGALYDWLIQYEEDCGTETELDVIALCCDFSEHDAEDLRDIYTDAVDADAELDEWIEWLHEQTIVIPVDADTVIIQDF